MCVINIHGNQNWIATEINVKPKIVVENEQRKISFIQLIGIIRWFEANLKIELVS